MAISTGYASDPRPGDVSEPPPTHPLTALSAGPDDSEAGFGRPGPHPVQGALAALHRLLDGLTDAPWWSLDDRLGSCLEDLDRALCRMEAVRLHAVREADGADLAHREGATSTRALLRDRLRVRPTQASRLTDLAAALDGPLAATGAALAAGAINADHAHVIHRTVHGLPRDVDAETRARVERFLLDQAGFFDPAELTRLGAHIRATLAPPQRDTASDPAAERGLWLTDTDDGTQLRATLDPEAAALLRSALDPLAAPDPADDGRPDPRTPARRRADALVTLVSKALNDGRLPTQGGIRPHLTVTVIADTLLDQYGGASGADRSGGTHAPEPRRAPPAQTSWGLALPATVLDRVACDATVTRVLVTPKGAPLDIGRESRVVPPAMRRALIARDVCCAHPGCTRPPSWCEAHHIVAWQHGGPTALHNLVLLCGRHHAAVHHGGWAVRIAADGLPEFVPPARIDPEQRPRRNPHCRPASLLLQEWI